MSEMVREVEVWPMERLVPYAGNPRKNDHAVEQVAEAIRQFGFRVPVVVRGEGEVIDGHLRLKAARHLGLAEVPVVRADDLTDAQVKAFRISINRMAELADWDLDLLKVELQDLQDLDFDVAFTGLDADLLKKLLPAIPPTEGLTDPDAVPPTPAEPTSRPGDLYLLGHHRLLCGDSTKAEDVARLMDGQKAQMIWTDPPYNVDYQGKNKKGMKIQNDKMAGRAFYEFLRKAFDNMAASVLPGGAIYVCHADVESINFRTAMIDAGFLVKQGLVWVKNSFILGRSDYHWQHEPILYGWLAGSAHRWFGDRKEATTIEGQDLVATAEVEGGYQISICDGHRSVVLKVPEFEVLEGSGDVRGTVWRVDKPRSNDDHPTMKPTALITRALRNSSQNGGIVLDLFGGGGSALIGCEQEGRIGYLMELDPKFCDVIVRRWEDFTGKKAQRIAAEG